MCIAPAYDGNGRLACHGPGPTDGMLIMANGRPFQRPGTHRGVSLPDREIRVTGVRGYFPDFLPDGRLVYGEWINDEADIAEFGMPPLVTTRVDGSDRRVVFDHDDRQPWAPSACGDGSWNAFNEGPTFAPVDEDVDVWKVRPDGTGAVNLTADSDANDAFPAWTPDCRTIVFRSGRDGDKEIYRMHADGSDVPVQAPGQPDPTGTLDEEILVEFAEALTSDPSAVEMLGPVDRLYAYGASQTAAVLLELRRAATRTESAGLFDFTLLHVAVWEPPFPDTAQFDHLKGDFEPLEGLGRVIFVESEGDLVVSSADQLRKAVGEPDYRVYEVAGAAHGRSEHNPLDHHAVARAMFVAGDRWTRTGTESPPSTLLEEAPGGRDDPVYEFETGIARDHDLNAQGGVRLPDLRLGRARFIASDSTTRPPRVPSRFAILYGSTVDLACEPAPGSDTDEPRFRAHEDYVDAFTRQVEELQRQGFLLEADAAEMKERAAGSDVGRPGTCDG